MQDYPDSPYCFFGDTVNPGLHLSDMMIQTLEDLQIPYSNTHFNFIFNNFVAISPLYASGYRNEVTPYIVKSLRAFARLVIV